MHMMRKCVTICLLVCNTIVGNLNTLLVEVSQVIFTANTKNVGYVLDHSNHNAPDTSVILCILSMKQIS